MVNHNAIRHHYIQERVKLEDFVLEEIDSHEILTDIMTKPLHCPTLE
jgi:hypothetical protein